MRLNRKFNGKKVLGLAVGLACAFTLYSATSALAESESGGFIMVGGGDSESGGISAQGASSESGGVYGSGAETETGGARNNGSESESGGVMSNGSESETGGVTNSGAETEASRQYVPNYGVKYYTW